VISSEEVRIRGKEGGCQLTEVVTGLEGFGKMAKERRDLGSIEAALCPISPEGREKGRDH